MGKRTKWADWEARVDLKVLVNGDKTLLYVFISCYGIVQGSLNEAQYMFTGRINEEF